MRIIERCIRILREYRRSPIKLSFNHKLRKIFYCNEFLEKKPENSWWRILPISWWKIHLNDKHILKSIRIMWWHRSCSIGLRVMGWLIRSVWGMDGYIPGLLFSAFGCTGLGRAGKFEDVIINVLFYTLGISIEHLNISLILQNIDKTTNAQNFNTYSIETKIFITLKKSL